MKKAALFTIKQGTWIEAILVSVPFCMFFVISGQFVWAFLVYATVLWLYRTFSFRFLRINRKSISGFRYAKPFRKTYAYCYADILQVYIPLRGRGGWEMEFVFKDGARFCSQVTDNIEVICRHFVDSRVPVETGSRYIRNMIVQYQARPQIDPRKQIALRKAREAARKARLTKLRRS